jgi:hypothetical protein
MTELINRLQTQANLSEAQAAEALQIIKDFVIEKFPMLAGAVDNIFQTPDSQAGGSSFADEDIL